MTDSDRITLGLAPALLVESAVEFGPLRLTPVADAADSGLAALATRFAEEREADGARQAVVTCSEALRPLVPAVWSLFVFACVSFARRQSNRRGVLFPENFHLLNVTSSRYGWAYDSGQSLGIGETRHVPLRWPVDAIERLGADEWDHRIELACTLVARDPARYAQNKVLLAAGMAADLACAAFERRSQKVENVATAARTYVLLGSAFEALHCRGSTRRHSHAEVTKAVGRFEAGSSPLGSLVFSGEGLKQSPPTPERGGDVSRLVFATGWLFFLRNTFAHGRIPEMEQVALPAELGGTHAMQAATSILGGLIGQDLCKELECEIPGSATGIADSAAALAVPLDLTIAARWDEGSLLRRLEEELIPAGERPRRHPPASVLEAIEPLGPGGE